MRAAVLFLCAVVVSSQVRAQYTFRAVSVGTGATTSQGAGGIRKQSTGAAPMSDGSVWVAGNGTAGKYLGGGNPILEIGESAQEPRILEQASVGCDDSGNVYIGQWDYRVPSRVSKFDPSGNIVWTVGLWGSGQVITRVDAAGNCYVLSGNRLSRVSSSGNPQWTIQLVAAPTNFCVDRQSGTIGAGQQLLSSSGNQIDRVTGERHIVAVGGGFAWVAPVGGARGPLVKHDAVTGSAIATVDSNYSGTAGGTGTPDGGAVIVLTGRQSVQRVTPAGGFPWTASLGQHRGGSVAILDVVADSSTVVLVGVSGN